MLEYTDPVAVDPAERSEMLVFAASAAVSAGAETLRYFRANAQVENKRQDGGFDPVTQADKAAEDALRRMIRARYPDHGLCGEEFGFEVGNGLTWVIDPIDGTRAFMSGMLHWGLLLALFDGQRPLLGVMYQPYTEELWLGDGVQAEFRRGSTSRRLRTRQEVTISEAVLATTSPRLFREGQERDGFAALEDVVRLSRYGGDCYIYGMLAMGYVDLATDATLNPYDIQALVPIIEGAGGVVSTVAGDNPSMGGTVLASGSRPLHEAALAVFNG